MNKYIPVIALLIVITLWWIAAHSDKPDPNYYKAGVNEIVAWDGGSCFLVTARSSWNITGDDRHTLPAGVFKQKNGLYLVAFGNSHLSDGRPVHGKWYKARGRIVPRPKRDLLTDIVEGWQHEFVSLEALETIPNP